VRPRGGALSIHRSMAGAAGGLPKKILAQTEFWPDQVLHNAAAVPLSTVRTLAYAQALGVGFGRPRWHGTSGTNPQESREDVSPPRVGCVFGRTKSLAGEIFRSGGWGSEEQPRGAERSHCWSCHGGGTAEARPRLGRASRP
jgi:hypothetical protein